MKITHYDLFAGIGGFSLALDTIFYDSEIKHIFCEWEAFPTAILRKHWPDGTYYGDIADLVADTNHSRRGAPTGDLLREDGQESGKERKHTQYRTGGQNIFATDTNSQRRERECREDEGRLRQSSGEVQDEEQVVANATNPDGQRISNGLREVQEENGEVPQRDNDAQFSNSNRSNDITILTGGFPCQPFSHAGRRQGTADDRYKWPDMFAVIQNVRPDWVIAENVRGLVTWNDGMVLETVCADLESKGYEVQPLVIPAVAIGAPHRRDRVWIVAHTIDSRQGRTEQGGNGTQDSLPQEHRTQNSAPRESERATGDGYDHRPWETDWREVAFASCDGSLDDGLPRDMAGLTISYAKYRRESLKSVGNSIVPQVAMQIFEAIKYANKKI